MCGIAGFVDYKGISSKKLLQKMTDVLYYRGPDDSGYSFYENVQVNIGLGHRRLSILDLSEQGHQPMLFEQLEIIYNGEVYNFKEIRKELEQYGYRFHSDSDTEVILKAYHKWGIKAVDRFNGMFAMAIYDKRVQKLILIRDRAGVKPLYWYWKEDTFLFSSELKSFHEYPQFEKQINMDALALYLEYGYILQPYTVFKNTYKLKSAHYLELDLKSKNIKEKKYWDVVDFYNKPKLDIGETEAIEHVETLFKSAFEYRMVSDVPVGVFLSGGYDSSCVTALLQQNRSEKLNTFTIGFYEKGFDEAPYAKKVAQYLGTNHTEYYCTQKDALDIIPKLAGIYDEPFGDSSAIPTTLVSALAIKDVTVALSADGGDEIFAGYTTYETTLNYFNRFSKIPNRMRVFIKWMMDRVDPKYIVGMNKTYNFATRYQKVKNLLHAETIIEALKYTSHQFTCKEVRKLLRHDISALTTNFDMSVAEHNDAMNQMLAIDYKVYMVDDILTKVDRAAMSVSLEGREPLLDYRIAEFVAQLPSKLKYRDGTAKWILKEITHKYVPKSLMDRPKMGFGVPITEWFKDALKEYFIIYLNKERLEREGVFNAEEVVKLRDQYLRGNRENIERLWAILMFEMWYERWM